jgi:hypothetical protein
MKLVKTEIFMCKTIEVFEEYNRKYYRFEYTVKIEGEHLHSVSSGKKRETPSVYATESRAIGAAKSSIRKNASKDDEIKRIEAEIAELQARLEMLRG